MGKTIKTTDLLDYIEIFNKNEYLIDKFIMKICPEFINNEDFKQDAKLALLEYIKDKESSNTITNSIHNNIYGYIKRTIEKLYLEYSIKSNTESLSYDLLDKLLWEESEICEIRDLINKILNTLPEIEVSVLKLRFGLDDGRPKTLEEVGAEFGVTRERIRHVEAKALRKLRHPSRSNLLKVYLR